MERVYVDIMTEEEIVFSSLGDMERAMNELANGKSIIAIFPIETGKKRAKVISVSLWNMITDGKLSVSANVQEGEE